MDIKLGVLEDLEKCVPLSKIPEFTTNQGLNDKQIIEYLMKYIQKGILLVAKEKNEILGYITGEYMLNNYVWVDAIVVNPEIRGKGIGKKLIQHFKEFAKSKGVEHIYLMAPKFNPNTVAFYQTVGMKKGEEFIEFSLDL